MDQEERDVEVFERIPWESLRPTPDRRWVAYLVAAGLVMGAVGVTVGRGMGAPAPSTTVGAVTTTPVPTVPVTLGSSVPVPPPPTAPTVHSTSLPQPEEWSEADLMAVPADAMDDVAAALAEWYVAEYFTRDDEEDAGRSFVEWVRVVDRRWVTTTDIDLTVAVRRLAAQGDDPYQRMPVEAWLVSVRLEEGEWVVVAGPEPAEPPALRVELVDENAEETLWTDPAGLEWVIPVPP